MRIKKAKGKYNEQILCLFLTLIFLSLLPRITVKAEEAQQITNMVIFVKYNDDNSDVLNEASNWQIIKQIYNTGTFTEYNNSFSHYISTITEGKVQVTNYFPQEKPDGSGVNILKLDNSEAFYSEDRLVKEVISALKDGRIPIDTSTYTLDNQTSGVLDNLTLIVQGNTINEESHAFHRRYNGDSDDIFGGLQVCDFNAIPSESLVNGNSVAPQQGVVAHEFLHTLGLSDLYRHNGVGEPVGIWDIMASTVRSPNYPLSYSRAQQGWVDMPIITQSGRYTLTAVSENGENKVFALRTPLSDSETICLEYRKRQPSIWQFDHYLPSSGLLMYRVDDKAGGANSAGDNYIYVYRPGVTDPDAATDVYVTEGGVSVNLVQKAALDVNAGETEYGSTDLSADFTQNTLYYSDGSNSGIRISNLALSQDETQISFTITFADYTASELWTKLGDKVGGNCIGEPVIYTDPYTGTLYAAYIEGNMISTTVGRLLVKRWNGTVWEQVGTAIEQVSVMGNPALAVCGGELYLSYLNSSSGNPFYCKLNGSSWSQIRTYGASYPLYMQFLVDGNEIYAAYQESSSNIYDRTCKLIIHDLKTGAIITDSLVAQDFRSPALVKSGNYIYMVNSDAPNGNAQVKVYDMTMGQWNTLHTFLTNPSSSFNNINIHQISIQDGKIYAFAGDGTANLFALTVYDGSSWTDVNVSGINHTTAVSMEVMKDRVYLTYYDTSARKGKVLCYTGSSFVVYSDTLGTGYSTLRTNRYGNKIYAVSKAENTYDVVVREKEVPGESETPPTPPEPIVPPNPDEPTPPNPPVTQEPLTLSLTPPAGYSDNHICVDGVEYTAVCQTEGLSVKLPDIKGRTAVMYCYDEKNIPIGMYVWKLSWQGDVCTATAMPGLKDLLSYHGFSIRVQSPAGIRFKSGIDPNLKQQLILGNVENCRLVEYGTLFITNENREKYPFIKGGTKVGGGRAYWTENGVVNDKVFETVGGRNRFTSVLINLAPNMYAKDISFRAYAILECDGQELCVYGPPVYRSVYTVAKQVQARGEFKVGSSGYNYVQSIIASVEGR